MPDNKFSGSVDEILENLKQQPTPDPASDRAVEDILAGLGLEEKLPRSARQAAPAAVPAREQKPAPAQAQRPAPAAPQGAAPAPAGERKRAPGAAAGAAQKPAVGGSVPMRETPRRAAASAPVLVPEPPAPSYPVRQAPAPPPADENPPPPGLSAAMQMDDVFQKFFSESVAVIPDEEPEQHPGFFARFLQRRKGEEEEYDDEFDLPAGGGAPAEDEPTVMIPGVTPPPASPRREPPAAPEFAPASEDAGSTGSIDLSGVVTGNTRTLELPGLPEGTPAPAGATGSIRLEAEPEPQAGPGEEESRTGRITFPKLFGKEPPSGEAFEEPEEEEYIEDYEDPADAPAVQADLAGMRARLGLRAALTGLVTLLMLYLGLAVGGSALPPIGPLDPAKAPAAYLTVLLILLLAACAINWRVFFKGIPGIWAAPTPDTLPALAALGAAFQLVFQLAGAEQFDAAAVTLFAAPAAGLLCLNAFGRFLMGGVVLRSFELASAGSEHTAAALVRDRELAARVAKGLGEPQPCLLVNRPTGLVKGFLRQSFSVRASDHTAQKLSWLLLGVSFVAALVCLFTGKGAAAALTSLAGTLCLGGPLAATLVSAVPGMLMQKSAARVGAVIPGWSAVAELGRANMVVAGAKDLFPAKSVRLHGIKTFDKQRIDLAILYAASVLIKGCDTLREVFLTIIQDRTDFLYPVENLENLPGYGFTAWVNNNRVLVGSRAMMQKQGVEIPSLDYEQRYTKGTKEPIYLAVSGRLFAMFLVSYRADPQAAEVLDTLRRQGVSVLVHSDDFSLTGALVAGVYGLPEDSVKVLTGADRKALDPASAYLRESEGCMTHLGTFSSFVGGLTAAAGAAWGERAASLVQAAGVAFSCALALLLAFTGGFAQLALPALLLYQAAWGVLALAMPLLKKY